MLLGATSSLSTQLSLLGAKSDAIMNTFNWLLVLGFPIDVAAAKAMPELFSDAAPSAVITDGVRVFFRDESAAA